MYLHEVISSGKKFKRSTESTFKTLDERAKTHGLPTEDLVASDWIIEEHKTDKVLAAELVIRLLENLTNEISKHNKEIREEVQELRQKLDEALNQSRLIINPGVPLYPSYTPWSPIQPIVTYSDGTVPFEVPATIKTGDPTHPIATVLEWSKTNE